MHSLNGKPPCSDNYTPLAINMLPAKSRQLRMTDVHVDCFHLRAHPDSQLVLDSELLLHWVAPRKLWVPEERRKERKEQIGAKPETGSSERQEE